MDLYPNDLGTQIAQQVQQERVRVLDAPEQNIKPKVVGQWGLSGIAITCFCAALGGFVIAVYPAFLTLCCFAYYFAAPIAMRRDAVSLQKPLSRDEITALRYWADDILLQSYIDLAQSVVALPDTKDETANKEVRDAVTALATAVETLPPEPITVSDDPPSLRAEAQTQIENAQGENDAVIAASQRRRAESLLRRADTAAKTLLLLRRNRALRDEVNEQIKALRTSLTALQIGGRQSTPELSGLAASIHRVALEANAVTVARAEVDTLLSQPVRPVEEVQIVRIPI